MSVYGTTIEYNDKVDLNTTSVANINKVSASDLNEIKGVVNNNSVILQNTLGNKLWENANPTASFSAQTITLSESLANYDCYEIMFRQSTRTARIMTSGKVPVGNGTILNWNAATTSGNVYFRATGPTVSGTSISFEDAKNSGTVDNLSTIPMYVIAYKTNLFS